MRTMTCDAVSVPPLFTCVEAVGSPRLGFLNNDSHLHRVQLHPSSPGHQLSRTPCPEPCARCVCDVSCFRMDHSPLLLHFANLLSFRLQTTGLVGLHPVANAREVCCIRPASA